MEQTTDLIALWRAIAQAGGRAAWVEAQLTARNLKVERRDTEEMSDREKETYKKELKAEAAERKKLAQEAWRAYKAAHVVHLGEGVHWHDEPGPDRWDLDKAEERTAENELPP